MSRLFTSGSQSIRASVSVSPSTEYSGLISFRINWFDLLAVQGTLKSLLRHHSLRASILQHSTFFMVQLSHPYMTTGKTIALTRQTFVGKVMSLLFSMLSRLNMSSRFNMLSKGLWRVFSSTTIQKHQFLRTQLSLCSNLKLNIRKTEIMTSSPITSWQMDEVIVEAVTDFIFLGFKITADGDCNHEIKRCLLLGRKTMTNLDRILKSRDISLLTKVCIVKDMVFSSSHIWMWEMDHLASGYHDIEHFCCLRKFYWHHFREWSLAIKRIHLGGLLVIGH